MKRIFIILNVLTMCYAFGQEIKVVEKENKEAVIEIRTVGNKQVPLYKILSETSGVLPSYDDTITKFTAKELQLIGNAPLSLELDSGLYEIQFYKDGDNKMIIESDGYDQIWEIKPRGKYEKLGSGLVIAGGICTLGGLALYGYYSIQSKSYNDKLDFYNSNPSFFDHPGEKPSANMSYTVLGLGITTLTTGFITWLINKPFAKQIK